MIFNRFFSSEKSIFLTALVGREPIRRLCIGMSSMIGSGSDAIHSPNPNFANRTADRPNRDTASTSKSNIQDKCLNSLQATSQVPKQSNTHSRL